MEEIQPSNAVLEGYRGQNLENLSKAEICWMVLGPAGYKVISFSIMTQGIVPILGLKSLKSFKLVRFSPALKMRDPHVHAVYKKTQCYTGS